MSMVRNTKIAALTDPDPRKRPSDEAVDLFLKNADYIFIGGTPESNWKNAQELCTFECVDRYQRRKKELGSNAKIYIFPGSPRQNVMGADYFMYLYQLNAGDSKFSWELQIESIDDVLKNYSEGRILDTAYIAEGGKVAKFTKAKFWDRGMLVKAAKIINRRNFPLTYLEGGSGDRMLDREMIKSFSETLHKNVQVVYGGGARTEDQIRSLCGIVDIINMGTVFEENPYKITTAREVVNSMGIAYS